MSGAVVNLAGEVMARHELPLDGARGRRRRSRSCTELAAELIALTDRPVLGVGVGSPGVVDADGTVLDAPNLGWTDTPLAGSLARALGLPVFVANDANTAVARRAHLRRRRRRRADGAPGRHRRRRRAGPRGRAAARPPLGAPARSATSSSTPTASSAPAARTGCLETLLAVPRLRRRLASRRRRRPTVLAAAGERLGAVLAPVVGALNLHEIVLSGPAELLDGPLRDAADRDHPRADDAGHRRRAGRPHSTLGEDVVLVGAAVLVLAGELGVS